MQTSILFLLKNEKITYNLNVKKEFLFQVFSQEKNTLNMLEKACLVEAPAIHAERPDAIQVILAHTW